jgi:UDP-glucose 4-epimerase
MEKKRIIVFGATGNIGAYTTVYLKQQGFDVIAVGNRKSDNGFFADFGVEYVSLNICDKALFSKLPQDNVFAVVNFAGELPSRYEYNPNLLIETITLGTLNILEYIRQVGCKKIIFPQTPFDLWYLHNTEVSIPADAQRDFPKTGDHAVYTIAKNAAVDLIEHYFVTYGIARFVLRFFTIYQYHPNPYHYGDGIRKKMPYLILIDKALNSQEIEIWGDPKRSKEIVYVKDFVRLVCKCVESDLSGGIYNVGNGKSISLEDQILGIVKVFSPKGNPSKVKYCSEKTNALQANFDISKTERELGYKPAYSYLEAMEDYYTEMKTEPFAKLWGVRDDYSL